MSEYSDFAMTSKAELLFPAHLIPSLRDLREDDWRNLVDHVSVLPETHVDNLAFVLMMIKLDGCLRCNSNNYKFLRGCYLCATQTIQSYKGTDEDLLRLYEKTRNDLELRLQQGVQPGELKIT
ncbi:MAG: hypothetical protein AAF639_03055 [Chloroflexota bacterium]